MEKEKRYKTEVNEEDLIRELNALWGELKIQNSPLAKEAVSKGIDLKDLPSENPLIVRPGKPGFAGAQELIIQFGPVLAPVVAKIVQDLWEHILLPWIKKKYSLAEV